MKFPILRYKEIEYSPILYLNFTASHSSYLIGKKGRELVEPLDLISDNIKTSDSAFRKGACNNAERWFQAVLFRRAYFPVNKSTHSYCYTNGVIVALNGVPLGILKLCSDGDNKTFLATKTVKDSKDNFSLVRGGIYGISPKIYAGVKESLRWMIVDVDELKVTPLRMATFGNKFLEKCRGEGIFDFGERLEEITSGAEDVLRKGNSTEKYKIIVPSGLC